MELQRETLKTIANMEALPEGTRAELIDGVIYDMSAPSSAHQRLVSFLHGTIWSYISSNGGRCEVFPAPYDVQLDEDDYTLVQPDISVICDRGKIRKNRCAGAPDWVIEVVSPSTGVRDYLIKLGKYQKAGVREYWIVDPMGERILVYDFNSESPLSYYTLKEKVRSNLYPDFEIDFSVLEL